jgi:ankyrin repeat protein
MHNFDKGFIKLLQTQLKLDFHNREIADEKVLSCFPQSLRRKVIRKLYLSSLIRSDLMKGIRQQFIDEFLSSCRVELFSPGEEILLRGGSSTDLYLLVEGSVRLFPLGNGKGEDDKPLRGKSDFGASSIPDSDATGFHRMAGAEDMVAGEFINDISFFTDSPESYTVRPIVVCKTLTISQAVFKVLAHDHPGSTGKILKNLLDKVARLAEDTEAPRSVVIPKNMTKHVAGSLYGDSSYHSGMDLDPSIHALDVQRSIIAAQHQSSFSKLQDLIKLHINKHKDVETTRFLFAASRSDTATISLMCDHGFDPDSADYDFRTALMVSAMKGHTETVRLLLEYGANPNLVDMHGSSALYEATKSGSEATMEELLKHRAGLCMEDNHAASLLCQAVFDGDVIKLRRLLRANIHVNASDYDKRAAVHIAGAEGNLAALKVLIEHGADLTMQDRWGNTAYSEAKNADAGQIINYLEQLET